jgi:hypothetical protein
MRLIIFILCLLNTGAATGQEVPSEFTVQFIPKFRNRDLHFNEVLEFDRESVQITIFKFYIGNITLLNKGEIVHRDTEVAHLVDHSDLQSERIAFDIPNDLEYDQFQFSIGTDSAINVSGALDGDLDPTKGMYWTWQSGYINFKMEGTATESKENNGEFRMHIGGYMAPFTTDYKRVFKTSPRENIRLEIAVDEILHHMDFESKPSIMSPGKEAKNVFDLLVSSISKKGCVNQ